MRIPLSRYGWPEVILLPIIMGLLALLIALIWPAAWPWPQVTALALVLLVWAFFRDPERQIPTESCVLLAPADGKVTDIAEVTEQEFIQGQALRIGIFLSISDVHINRVPCQGKVTYVRTHPGRCYNALRVKAASQYNRANCVGLDCPDHPAGKVMVKQITGVIARRIVCACAPGDCLAAGERFGMIKFGSRTELYVPKHDSAEILVKKGQAVRAGTTIMIQYRPSDRDQLL